MLFATYSSKNTDCIKGIEKPSKVKYNQAVKFLYIKETPM